jgi:hypothetical protein
MGQAFGVQKKRESAQGRPSRAAEAASDSDSDHGPRSRGLIRYSKTHDTYVPTDNESQWVHFKRDAERDRLGVKRTSLVYVKQSMFLMHPAPLLNDKGEIELRDSVVGDGLYASKRLPKHTVIGEYRGKIIVDEDHAKGDSSYRFLVEDINTHTYMFTIDGENEKGSSIVRYANAVDSRCQQNAAFVQFPPPGAKSSYGDHRILLVSLRHIARDEEIVAWYGEDTATIIDAPAPKPSGLCNIDRILKMRKRGKKREYLVRWDGYDKKHDSWEPGSGIPPGVIREFDHARKESATKKAERAGRGPEFGSGRGSRRRRETTRSVPRASTYVAQSRIEGCVGEGLFASRRISEGQRVVGMGMPTESAVPRPGMPDDSIVYLSKNGMRAGVRDDAWTRGTRKPRWYLLNHAGHGNTRAVYVPGREFYWAARRDIERGEELTFNYNPGRPVYFD